MGDYNYALSRRVMSDFGYEYDNEGPSVLKKVLAVVLMVAAAVSSGVSGYKVGKHNRVKVIVLDPATMQPAPLKVPDGTQIFVFGPEGVEPGVNAEHSKDGTKILIAPPSLMGMSYHVGDATHDSAGNRLTRI